MQLNKNEQITVNAIRKLFSNTTYLFDFFLDDDHSRIRFRPDKMRWEIQDLFNDEQILIRVGLDIWSGSGDARVWELLEFLNDDDFEAAIGALLLVKRGRS